MDRLDALEQKVDNLQATLNWFIQYTLERDRGDYDRDVSANLVADAVFEAIFNPQSFFDRARK